MVLRVYRALYNEERVVLLFIETIRCRLSREYSKDLRRDILSGGVRCEHFPPYIYPRHGNKERKSEVIEAKASANSTIVLNGLHSHYKTSVDRVKFVTMDLKLVSYLW